MYEGTCSRQLDKRPVIASYRAAGISGGEPNKEPVIHNGRYFASHMADSWKAEKLARATKMGLREALLQIIQVSGCQGAQEGDETYTHMLRSAILRIDLLA
jgi:hypothetical protein